MIFFFLILRVYLRTYITSINNIFLFKNFIYTHLHHFSKYICKNNMYFLTKKAHHLHTYITLVQNDISLIILKIHYLYSVIS